jgi:cell division protein FtsB
MRILFMRMVFVGAFGLVAWIGAASYRFFERTGMIESEIQALEREADRIGRENATLKEKIEYFSSADFQEREAKDKLGLKKVDEQVVIIRMRPETGGELGDLLVPTIDTGRVAEFRSPNYVKWWRMIFGDRRPI